MPATSDSIQAVFTTLHELHPRWPHATDRDTVAGDLWPLAWDAATVIDEWFSHSAHTDIEETICYLPLDPWKFGYDVTAWHSKREPQALLRAHLLRIVKGWRGETALHNYLTEHPALVEELGFENGAASKATLWRVWNTDRLSDSHKAVLRTIGQVLVNVAREHDIPAPDEVFHPDPGVDAPEGVEQNDQTVRHRTIAKTREVWQQAKPMVTKNYTIPRAENTEIHVNAFLEGNAFIGSREEMYAEDGTWNFAAETTRDRVQSGSTHRYHLQKISPDTAREMHRETTQELIKRARRDAELVGGVTVAIDITKSNPTGKVRSWSSIRTGISPTSGCSGTRTMPRKTVSLDPIFISNGPRSRSSGSTSR
jgi:hypothetical protein